MRIVTRTFVRLGAAVCVLLLVAGGRASATAPELSGIYALKIHKVCQPFFSGQMNGDSVDNDVSYTGFYFAGSIKDQIGVVTFNWSNKTVTGSMFKVSGTVAQQDLSALGVSVTGQPFTASSKTISGTFSTTATTFTVDTGDGSMTFQAVYGALSSSVAHVVFFVNISTDGGGNSCEESGELQFK